MSIYPEAIWHPGPSWKTNFAPLVPSGVVCHSAVGYRHGLHDVLGGPFTRASWHFSILYDGTVEQHYDTTVQCWHAQAANAFAVGIEHEGGFNPENEPLTREQLDASVRLVRWLAAEHGFDLVRHGANRTLWEHNEFYPKPCPSGRIPWDAYPVPTVEHDANYWLELAMQAEVEEEADVDVRPLDQGETIAALESVARSFGGALNDQDVTVVEVTGGSPVQPPPGGRVFLFTTRD